MDRHFINLILFSILIANPCMAGNHGNIVISLSDDIYHNFFSPENGSKVISIYSSNSHAISKYYTISNTLTCNIYNLLLSSTGSRIAFCQSCKDMNSYYYQLIILDLTSKNIIALMRNGGTLFSFSPKGDSIVYAEEIPGEPGSPAPPGYQGGVWLYNFNTKTKKLILPTSIVVKDINWSEHDGNIYFQTYPQIIRYNVANNKVESVSYKGIYFTSDGKYYAETIMGGSNIYRTSDNIKMTDWKQLILDISEKKPDSMSFQFWSKKLKAGIFSISGEKNVVFDVEQGKVIGVFTGYVIGTNPDGTLVAVHPSGKDGRSKVEILNLLDLVNKSGSPK